MVAKIKGVYLWVNCMMTMNGFQVEAAQPVAELEALVIAVEEHLCVITALEATVHIVLEKEQAHVQLVEETADLIQVMVNQINFLYLII